MKESLRDRVCACFLAGAVGDALGAPFEFASLGEIRSQAGAEGVREYGTAYGRRGAITDDTQMSLFTAEGLILAARAGALERPSEVVRVVHRAYLRWLRTQGERSRHPTYESARSEGWLLEVPELHARREPGPTCLAALRSARMGKIEEPLNHSKGCGGVMRVAPVGLALTLDDPFRLGSRIAGLTHGHPTGQLAAGALALVVRELLLGTSLEDAIREASSELRRHPNHGETSAALEGALARAAEGGASAEAVASLGEGWVAEEALAIALYCALASPDLSSGLRRAVNHGGDSDSTGAIAGSLLGLLHGRRAIPEPWLAQLELRDEVERTASEFCNVLVEPWPSRHDR